MLIENRQQLDEYFQKTLVPIIKKHHPENLFDDVVSDLYILAADTNLPIDSKLLYPKVYRYMIWYKIKREFNFPFEVPLLELEFLKQVTDAIDALTQNQIPVTESNLASKIGIEDDRYNKGRKALRRLYSLTEPTLQELDTLQQKSYDHFYDNVELSACINNVLKTLYERQEKILRWRFGIGELTDYSLDEVAEKELVTKERIRQIEAKALRKLRHPSRAEKLKTFYDQSYLEPSEEEKLEKKKALDKILQRQIETARQEYFNRYNISYCYKYPKTIAKEIRWSIDNVKKYRKGGDGKSPEYQYQHLLLKEAIKNNERFIRAKIDRIISNRNQKLKNYLIETKIESFLEIFDIDSRKTFLNQFKKFSLYEGIEISDPIKCFLRYNFYYLNRFFDYPILEDFRGFLLKEKMIKKCKRHLHYDYRFLS